MDVLGKDKVEEDTGGGAQSPPLVLQSSGQRGQGLTQGQCRALREPGILLPLQDLPWPLRLSRKNSTHVIIIIIIRASHIS